MQGPGAGGAGAPAKLPPRVFRGDLCNYSVAWSPYDETKLAVAQAQYFGMVGSGAVAVLNVDAAGIAMVQ